MHAAHSTPRESTGYVLRLALISGTLAFLFALGLLAGHRLPIVADDLRTWALWLDRPAGAGPLWWPEHPVFARLPLTCASSAALLALGAWHDWPRVHLALAHAAHAAAVALGAITLARGLSDPAQGGEARGGGSGRVPDPSESASVPKPLALVGLAVLAALSPNHYEVLLWHGSATHAWGLLVAAIGLSATARAPAAWRIPIRGAAGGAAILFYDANYFFFAGFVAIECLIARRGFLAAVAELASPYLVAGAIRSGLGAFVGRIHVPELDPLGSLSRLARIPRTLFLLHFYKASWPASLLWWPALAAGILGFRRLLIARAVSMPRAWAATLSPVWISLPLLALPYDGPRIYYGAQALLESILALGWWRLASGIATPAATRRLRAMSALLLASAIVPQLGIWFFVLGVKDRNASRMETLLASTHARILACRADPSASACPVRAEEVSGDFEGDWVLPDYAKPYFLRLSEHDRPSR